MSKPDMRCGDTWLMKRRSDGEIIRVRLVSLYQSAVEVEERSTLIGYCRPYIVDRDAVVFVEKVKP